MNPNRFIHCKTVAGFTLGAILTALLLLQFVLPTPAWGGKNFAGLYSLTNATVVGDQVRLTFSARIFNYSGSDVTSATLTLKGPGAPHGVYATIYGLNVPDHGTAVTSKEITIPAAEYQRWKTGRAPLLALQSAAVIARIELQRGPVGGE